MDRVKAYDKDIGEINSSITEVVGDKNEATTVIAHITALRNNVNLLLNKNKLQEVEISGSKEKVTMELKAVMLVTHSK